MANTPFLDLVKPAGTDRALVSVINSNSDKIDGGVSTLSEQIETKVFESDTLTNVQTAIYNYVGGMKDGEQKTIRFGISTAEGVFSAATFIGDLRRLSRTRFTVNVQQAVYNTYLIVGRYKDGVWDWQQCAFKSEITSDSGLQYIRLDGNNSYIMYRKIGNVVGIYLYHKISSATIAPWANLFFSTSFPSEYRPKVDMVTKCVADRSGSEGCSFFVNANGNIYIAGRYTGASDTNDILQASVSYVV